MYQNFAPVVQRGRPYMKGSPERSAGLMEATAEVLGAKEAVGMNADAEAAANTRRNADLICNTHKIFDS